DTPLPRDCDDEFWDKPIPGHYSQQPSGRLTLVSYFIHLTRLRAIQGFALRTLFSASRRKQYEWEERVIKKMNDMLASWAANIPPHLIWNLGQADTPFSRQSTLLYGMYYYTQIMIHRPFVI
ncbi:hypothetical protein PUNSTDRAFT_62251, partial [Punctularia strigosozonata HHB-11173 SS5]|uniref:uncharacterized protein n=1 Tax=Punctularia strigosozonata (strain HHB-11173) TaxID=741275 RepID=UPI0004417556